MKCVLISRPQLKGGKRRKGRMKDPTEVASQLIKIQVNYSNKLFFFKGNLVLNELTRMVVVSPHQLD